MSMKKKCLNKLIKEEEIRDLIRKDKKYNDNNCVFDPRIE